MKSDSNILKKWLLEKSQSERQNTINKASQLIIKNNSLSMKCIIEQLAAGILNQFADDNGLSSIEVQQLLKRPRRDAMQSLITIIEFDE